jgi:hypothetical protein
MSGLDSEDDMVKIAVVDSFVIAGKIKIYYYLSMVVKREPQNSIPMQMLAQIEQLSDSDAVPVSLVSALSLPDAVAVRRRIHYLWDEDSIGNIKRYISDRRT